MTQRSGKPARTVHRARVLRQAMTLPESLLWQHLKASASGHRFRRQHPAGPYVLDFFCARANLALEIDGMAHDMGDHHRTDAARDAWLREHRIAVLRIPAREVLDDPARVAEAVVAAVNARMSEIGKAPPSGLRPATSPSQVDGEGLG